MAATATPQLTTPQRAAIAAALVEREAHAPCAGCGPLGQPTVQGWLINLPITHAADRLTFAEQIPVAVVICGNCGHVRLHAVGTLGLTDVLNASARDDEAPAAVVDLPAPASAPDDVVDEAPAVDEAAPAIPAPAAPADDPTNLDVLNAIMNTPEPEPAAAG